MQKNGNHLFSSTPKIDTANNEQSVCMYLQYLKNISSTSVKQIPPHVNITNTFGQQIGFNQSGQIGRLPCNFPPYMSVNSTSHQMPNTKFPKPIPNNPMPNNQTYTSSPISYLDRMRLSNQELSTPSKNSEKSAAIDLSNLQRTFNSPTRNLISSPNCTNMAPLLSDTTVNYTNLVYINSRLNDNPVPEPKNIRFQGFPPTTLSNDQLQIDVNNVKMFGNLMFQKQIQERPSLERLSKFHDLVEFNRLNPNKTEHPTAFHKTTPKSLFTTQTYSFKSPNSSVTSPRLECDLDSSSLFNQGEQTKPIKHSSGKNTSSTSQSNTLASPIFNSNEFQEQCKKCESSTPYNNNLPLKKRMARPNYMDRIESLAKKERTPKDSDDNKKESRRRQKASKVSIPTISKDSPSQPATSQMINTKRVCSVVPKIFLPLTPSTIKDASDSDDDVIVMNCHDPRDSYFLNNI